MVSIRSSRQPPNGFIRPFAGFVLAAVLLLSGCAHYRLGPPEGLNYTSIYVQPVVNRSLAPQSQALLSAALARSFERDGRLRLATAADAELVLSTTLTEIRREPEATTERDTGLARKLRITLSAQCTLTERATGKVLFANRPVSAQTEAFVDPGHVQAEYQAMPVLTDKLAANISHAVLDVW